MNSINLFLMTDSEEAKAGYYLASLTTMKRNEWFKIRRHWFGSGVNAQSLEILESSIFLVSIMLIMGTAVHSLEQ